ncbi:TetR family transcriptional regulator C-terminal domain-containing protein [Nocardia puris]|uniref:TetR family transcriptional regulator C-terminal domain-containing protein n=1 Tax=Nocardia puris TaxID=208602 RepID=UPI002B4AE8E8|nr:TetR family transcriptional regulator C-terminal domain-containing protein [Nocardia puris]
MRCSTGTRIRGRSGQAIRASRSYTTYFADKDALVRGVIKTQLDRILAAQNSTLSELSSWEGLQRWCEQLMAASRATHGAGGCPLGSLVGELADGSEAARQVLADCFAVWQSHLSEGFTAMRDRGELTIEADPDELALTVMSALQGGLLMAQVTHGERPLELALNMAFNHVSIYRRRVRRTRPTGGVR